MRTRWFLLGVCVGGAGSFVAILLSLSMDPGDEEEDDL
jgi:hypothetical protein